MINKNKKIIVIGAGPAGLSFSYELLKNSNNFDIEILEKENYIGGISRTVDYKGNKIDIGGHRFFSKIERVNVFWKEILEIKDPEKTDDVFMTRNRLSRIFFIKKFFNYPISLNIETLLNLGILRSIKIFFSYLKVIFFKTKDEKTLEDFYINRFGKELYSTFFKDYTEKVWGVSCDKISKEWGGQRVKGLSITKAILEFIKKSFKIKSKKIETSLIDNFLYPKFGPGQMYENIAKKIQEKLIIKLNYKIKKIIIKNNKVLGIINGDNNYIECDYLTSTMPIKDLISIIEDENLLEDVKTTASNLIYRDFITVGILLDNIKIKNKDNSNIKDNWIYIQDRELKLGRLQVFNNWSEYMVKDKKNIWLGLEYFCNENDDFWNKTDIEIKEAALKELIKIGFINNENNLLDFIVIKQEKAYPAYFGSYNNFHIIKNYINNIENLYCIGRNGMHKYNNMDHSILSGMIASDCILENKNKSIIWEINTEEEYHEKKDK